MKLVVNGVEMEVEAGKNALDLAGEISKELKKEALAARLNGEVISLVTPINEEGTLEIVGFEDEDGRRTLRHTASHVLAQAVKHLKPEAKLAIGPAIENGFYYDFDVDEPFTPGIPGRRREGNAEDHQEERPRGALRAAPCRGAGADEKDEPYKVGAHQRSARGRDDVLLYVRATSPTCARARICPAPAGSRP